MLNLRRAWGFALVTMLAGASTWASITTTIENATGAVGTSGNLVTISLSDYTDGLDLTRISFEVNYDPAVFEFDAGTGLTWLKTLTPTAGLDVIQAPAAGRLVVFYQNAGGALLGSADVNGDLLTLDFTVKQGVDAGDRQITFADGAAIDSINGSVTATFNDGTFTVLKLFNAINDTETVAEDSGVTTIDALANDVDENSQVVTGATITGVTSPANGTASFTGTSVTYEPNAHFFGSDQFDYTAEDASGNPDTGTVTVTVTPVNDAPVGNDDTGTTDQDNAVTIDVIDGDGSGGVADTDVEGDALSVDSLNTTGTNGTVTDNQDGTLTYDPNGAYDYLGQGADADDTFVYTVTDGDLTDTATVTITINGVNDPPTANADTATTDENTPITIDGVGGTGGATADTDPDAGDTLTIIAVDRATDSTVGSVSIAANKLDYDPNGQFEALAVGDSAADTFRYTIEDGQGVQSTATVTVTITGVNDAPVATDDALDIDEDDAETTVPVVVGNGNGVAADSDVDTGDTINVVNVDTTGTLGSVRINPADATQILYDPNGQFEALPLGTSQDDTFTYSIEDAQGAPATATVTIAIQGANDEPVADPKDVFFRKDDITFAKEIQLSGSDVDTGATLTYQIVSQGTKGTAVVDADTGVATYTLTNGAAEGEFYDDGNGGVNGGPDQFTYTVTDENAGVSTAVPVVITYRSNIPPAVDAVTPDYTGADPDQQVDEVDGSQQATTVVFDITFNDGGDAPEVGDYMQKIDWYEDNVLQDTTTATGTPATLQSSYTFTAGYDKISSGDGTHPDDQLFTIKAIATDHNQATTTIEWVVQVDNSNQAPSIASVDLAVQGGGNAFTDSTMVATPNGENDADNDPVSFVYEWFVNDVPVAGQTTNTLTGAHFDKGDTVRVEITPDDSRPADNLGAAVSSSPVTVLNTVPVADAQTVAATEDQVLTITLTGSDTDNDTLTFAPPLQTTQGGTLSISSSTGMGTYTPALDFSGVDTFTFTVDDGDAARVSSAPATVTINVAAVNDGAIPVDTAASVRLQTDGSVSVPITLSATDVDGTIALFEIRDLSAIGGKGSLRAADDPTAAALGEGDTVAASGNRATVYFFPGLADPPITGAASFTYAAEDNLGLRSYNAAPPVADGTVTIGIGTPPWYPVIAWADDQAGGDAIQYDVTVTPRGGARDGHDAVLKVSVTGRRVLMPADYIKGGNRGLISGDVYDVVVEKHSVFDLAGTTIFDSANEMADEPVTVTAYDAPTQPTPSEPTDDGAREVTGVQHLGGDLYAFWFDVANASGYQLRVYDGSGEMVVDREEFFGLIPDSGGLVEFVGPFNRTVQLPASNGSRATYTWEVRGFNPDVSEGTSKAGVAEISADGIKAYGAWSDLTSFDVGTADCTTTTPDVPVLRAEADQTAGAENTLDVTLEWSRVGCATDYYVSVRNLDTGATEMAGFAGQDANGAGLPYVMFAGTKALAPGRYIWTVAAYNADAAAADAYSRYAALDDFRIIANANQDDGDGTIAPGLVGNLLPPDTGQFGLGGSSTDPVFQLRCNNASSFDIRMFDYTRRRWLTFDRVPNLVGGTPGVGVGTQTVFVGTQVRDGSKYKYQARGRFVADDGSESTGPWSRMKIFRGGATQ